MPRTFLISAAARTASLVAALESAEIYGGLTQTLLEVEAHHPPEVIEALLRGALALMRVFENVARVVAGLRRISDGGQDSQSDAGEKCGGIFGGFHNRLMNSVIADLKRHPGGDLTGLFQGPKPDPAGRPILLSTTARSAMISGFLGSRAKARWLRKSASPLASVFFLGSITA